MAVGIEAGFRTDGDVDAVDVALAAIGESTDDVDLAQDAHRTRGR
jgi:hypothetical protein